MPKLTMPFRFEASPTVYECQVCGRRSTSDRGYVFVGEEPSDAMSPGNRGDEYCWRCVNEADLTSYVDEDGRPAIRGYGSGVSSRVLHYRDGKRTPAGAWEPRGRRW